MEWYRKLGLTGKIVVPLLIVFPAITWFQVSHINSKSRDNSVHIATASAKSTIQQYKILRGYYTKNIVQKVKSSQADLKFHFDHKGTAGVLPLPATVIQDLSQELSKDKSGVQLSLYSDKPFPNRQARKLDDFQKRAIASLTKSPDSTYVEETNDKGNPLVRVAIADKLVAEGCVGCHNNHPQTPFKGWKLGDVRGILEAKVPISESLAAGSALATDVGWTVFFSGVLVIALIVLILSTFIVKPVEKLTLSLRESANDSVAGSEAIKLSTNQILDAAKQEASNIQSTTSALDEITAMVNQSAEQAKQSGEKAQNSSVVAVEGKKAIDEVSNSMRNITSSAEIIESNVKEGNKKLRKILEIIQEISQKTTVINDIVFQTKLLSFNASVEAARAGEHGKGFAVVAEEVGNLAQMSGSSASEINKMLQDSVVEVEKAIAEIDTSVQGAVSKAIEVVQSGNESVSHCERTLDQIVRNVNDVRGHMDAIVNAGREQQSGINEISTSVHSIDQASQQTTTASGKAYETAAEIVERAKALKSIAEGLEEQVLGKKGQAKNQRSGGEMDDHGEKQVV